MNVKRYSSTVQYDRKYLTCANEWPSLQWCKQDLFYKTNTRGFKPSKTKTSSSKITTKNKQ